MGLVRLAFERADDERPALQIDFDDVVGDDPRAEVERLLPHQLHQLRAGDGVLALVDVHVLHAARASIAVSRKCCKSPDGKAGVVLDLGRERELPQRQRAGEAVLFGDRAFEHQRLQSPAPHKSPPTNRPGRCR